MIYPAPCALANEGIKIIKESYHFKVVNFDVYEKSIEIEGFNYSSTETRLPIYIQEGSVLNGSQLFIEKKQKWRSQNISNNLEVSTIDFSSFFSGIQKHYVLIPPYSHFKLAAQLSEKHTIFISTLFEKGYFDCDSIEYEFELPVAYILSGKNGIRKSGNFKIGKEDIREDIPIIIHPENYSPTEYFSNWMLDKAKKQMYLSDDKIPQELTAFAANHTPIEVAEYCFYYVTQKIKYVDIENGIGAIVPRRCEYVLENGIGDCKDMSTLLTVLLNKFNIEAYLGVSKTNSKSNTFNFPSLGEANHMICVAKLNDSWYFLDATEDACIFGDPSIQILGTEAFLLGFQNGIFMNVPSRPRSDSRGKLTYEIKKLEEKMTMTIDVSGKLNSLYYHFFQKEKKPQKIFESIYRETTGMNWVLDSFVISRTNSCLQFTTRLGPLMFSSIGKKRLYDMSFVPGLEMISLLFYNNNYPLFSATIDVSFDFDGEIQTSFDNSENLIFNNSKTMLNLNVQFSSYSTNEEFIKSNLYLKWTENWSKPITISYED